MSAVARLIKTETGDDGEIVQTVEAHYNENKYCDQYAPSGDDSPPLPEDRVVCVDVEGTGNAVAVGVLCESQGAEPGERIIYSRDGDGNLVAKIYLKKDGSMEVTGDGDFEITLKGEMKIKIDGDASIEAGGDINIKADGDINIESSNATIKADKFSVNDGNLEVT